MPPYIEPTQQLVTEIFVREIKRSTEFYRRLGFELVRDSGGFVVLSWEGQSLFLDEREDLPTRPDFPQANVRVMVPNVDDYWTLVAEMGFPVIAPIADRRYGLRDFTIADPDGFGVRFGTHLSDLTQV